MPRRRPDPEPLELDNTRIVAVLTLCWLVGLLVLAGAAATGARVPGWWLGMCGYGVVLGVAGLRTLAVRQLAARRRQTGSRSSSAGSA